jgi:hypothetical protein
VPVITATAVAAGTATAVAAGTATAVAAGTATAVAAGTATAVAAGTATVVAAAPGRPGAGRASRMRWRAAALEVAVGSHPYQRRGFAVESS